MRTASRLLTTLGLCALLSPLAFAQSARVNSPANDAVSAYPDRVEVLSTRGGATVYTSRAAFEADCGTSGLRTETFEEATTTAGGSDVVGAPLPPEDGTIFPVGSIEPGLVVTVDTASGLGDDLFVSGSGFGGAPSIQVGNNRFSDQLRHEFSPNVDCAGYDVDLNRLGTTTTIDAVDASGNVLGSASVSGFAVAFVGFKSTSPRIAAIVANGDLSSEWVDTDNVSFGNMAMGGCSLSFNGAVTASPNPAAPGTRVRFNGRVVNSDPSGSPAKQVKLVVRYNRNGGPPMGMLMFGPAPLGPTSTSGVPLPASVGANIPPSAPAGTYNLTFELVNNGTGEVCDTETTTLTVTAPRVGAPLASGEALVGGGPLAFSDAATAAVSVSPNPFVGSARIAFATDASADVRLAVYDVLGREVAVLVDGPLDAGAHVATFEADGLAAGTYVYRLAVGADVQTGRITLAR